MRYATLTLNPCIDKTMFFDTPFEAGRLNRAETGSLHSGGKGLNVSRVLKTLGVEAPALGFCGGETGMILEKLLDEEGITHQFAKTEAPTRVCVKMIDSGGVCTECNESGGPIKKSELAALLKTTNRLLGDAGDKCYFFMGGSIPKGIEKSAYADIISFYKDRRVRFILDADGEALTKGLAEGPWMIKPNLYELSGLVGFEIDSVGDAISACRTIADTFGTRVLCTLGEKGSLYVSDEGVWECSAPKVPMRGFSGAGDTYLAGFISLLTQGGSVPESLRFGAAMAAAKVSLPGNTVPSVEEAETHYSNVSVRKLF